MMSARTQSKVAPFIVMIIIMLVGLPAISQLFKGPVEVDNFALTPTSVRANTPSEIHLTLKNVDHQSHQIKLVFSVGPRVILYKGAEQPLELTQQGYTYSFNLPAEDPDVDKLFIVKASIEVGASSATYPISMKVFVDGSELSGRWDVLQLTVKP